jgi:Tol biopolymer transport system component
VLDLENLESSTRSRITFEAVRDDSPVWSPDSSTLYYRSYPEGQPPGIYRKPAQGGDAELVYASDDLPNPSPWSMPDDSTLLLVAAATMFDADLLSLDVETQELTVALDKDGVQVEPSVSPAEPWMIYYESANALNNRLPRQIYLHPYPDIGRQQVEVASGRHPVFSADGSEVFFFDGEGLAVAPVQYAPLRVGNSRMLFSAPREYWWGSGGIEGSFGRAWDIDHTRDRFLMISLPASTGSANPVFRPRTTAVVEDDGVVEPHIRVVVNWFNELRERVQP